MIRREDFIDAMGMPDEGFERAVDAALQQVKESEARPVMKRKLTGSTSTGKSTTPNTRRNRWQN